MNKMSTLDMINEDYIVVDDFIKQNNYSTLDTCFNCKYSDISIDNELYCKKMASITSKKFINLIAVDNYAKCDLHEINF